MHLELASCKAPAPLPALEFPVHIAFCFAGHHDRQKGIRMNAISTHSIAEDADTFMAVLLQLDPEAMQSRSFEYPRVKEILRMRGWTPSRLSAAVNCVCSRRNMVISNSGQSVKFSPPSNRRGICRYCGKHSKRITKDHVKPRAKGGCDEQRNIVWACETCNQSKADRTPAQWAADVIRFRGGLLSRLRLLASVAVLTFTRSGGES